jgi:hypothetical protein
MTPRTPRRRLPLQGTDLQGLARLATDATLGVVDVVEAMHHTIARRAAPLGPATQGPAPGVARSRAGGAERRLRRSPGSQRQPAGDRMSLRVDGRRWT